jgi:REP element-mobilizing transposase RayT
VLLTEAIQQQDLEKRCSAVLGKGQYLLGQQQPQLQWKQRYGNVARMMGVHAFEEALFMQIEQESQNINQ